MYMSWKGTLREGPESAGGSSPTQRIRTHPLHIHFTSINYTDYIVLITVLYVAITIYK